MNVVKRYFTIRRVVRRPALAWLTAMGESAYELSKASGEADRAIFRNREAS